MYSYYEGFIYMYIEKLIWYFHTADDDEVRARGPGICRRLTLRRTNCWDGDNERNADIDEFDSDDIDGQGMHSSHNHSSIN